MYKVLIVRPATEKRQDLAGLKTYLETHTERITLTENPDRVEIKCPANYVAALGMLMPKYGYWVSEIQDVEEPV